MCCLVTYDYSGDGVLPMDHTITMFFHINGSCYFDTFNSHIQHTVTVSFRSILPQITKMPMSKNFLYFLIVLDMVQKLYNSLECTT